jgi:Uncharacterized protein conserved in bacteria
MPFIVPTDDKVLLKIGEGKHDLLVQPENFNIFVWNVYKGQKFGIFEQDFQRLGDGKDFILLQEALVDKRMPKLWEENFSTYEWHLAQSFHYKKDLSSTGVAIGSRYHPKTVDFIRAKSREMFWLTPKLSLFTEYQFGDQKVLFVCTHVLNFVTTGAFSRSLYEIAEKIALFSGPVILAGDFNTWNFKRYMIMKSIFRDLKMEHVDFEEDGRLLKLDHVFVRGFDIVDAKVHHTILSSDHFPLDLKVRLATPPKTGE